MLSSIEAMGSISAVVILVAKRDWCPSLSVKSVMCKGFLAIDVSFLLSLFSFLLYLRSSRSFRIDRSYVFSPSFEKKQPGTSRLSL
jgi:hypothetical protein